jgi:hypothetical protein
VELPARLAPGAPVDRLSPRTLDPSIARSRSEHPTITTAIYNVDRVPAGEGRGSRALSHPTIPVLALQRGPVMNSFYEDHRDSIHWHYRCFDRILLNGLIQPFQQPERVVGFFNTYRQLYPMTRYTLCDIG